MTCGPGGLLGFIRTGQTVVDMSTAPPRLMRDLAPAFEAKGVDFADAPVARTRRAAVDATLSITVGGSEAVFARMKTYPGNHARRSRCAVESVPVRSSK